MVSVLIEGSGGGGGLVLAGGGASKVAVDDDWIGTSSGRPVGDWRAQGRGCRLHLLFGRGLEIALAVGSGAGADPLGAAVALVAGSGGGQRVVGDVFVGMHGRGVLPEVVEARKPAATVTHKRALAGMFSRWLRSALQYSCFFLSKN